MPNIGIGAPVIIGIVIAVVVLLILLIGYRKASPDRAIVISGPKKRPRVLIGRSGFIIPFLEKTDYLYLKQVTVPIRTSENIPTNDLINVAVEAVFKIQICTETDKLGRAMTNFLNKSPDAIIQDTADALSGNMREIVGTMKLEELIKEKDKFSQAIKDASGADMDRLGLEIVTCNIKNITDPAGMIDDLGAYNIAAIKKEAAINRANAEKEIAVAQAEADRISNDARVDADTEIAKKENDLAIERARLKALAENERAKAEASFGIEEEAQRKTKDVATVDADIAKAKAEGELREQEVELRAKVLEAEVNKKADAELYQRTKAAEAARAEREEAARAERIAMEEEAKGIKAKAEAEAEAIRMKGQAEALAIKEKAEAMKQYGEAAIIEMIINQLPEVAKNVAEPMSRIGDVTIIGGDGKAVSGMSENVPLAMAQTFKTIHAATGVDLTQVIRAETFEGKTTKNINFTGLPEGMEVTQGAVNEVVAGAVAE